MQERLPLVYLYGTAPGSYVAGWPAFIIADDPATHRIHCRIGRHVAHRPWHPSDSRRRYRSELGVAATSTRHAAARREYITSTFQRRLHQCVFRERVLSAYRSRTARFCHLRHQELLDAAHIIPDTEPDGEPVVPNGLALCKLHHAAYDRNFLTVTPGYVIEVRRAILEEEDGPMRCCTG